MENQKQTQKQNQVQEQKQTEEQKNLFVKRSELTKEEISKLPKYKVSFIENSKMKNANFIVELVEGKCLLNADYKNRTSIDVNTWNLIKILAKQTSSFSRKLPVRFPKGIGKNGKVYHLWELFVTETINYSGFLTKNDLELIDVLVANGQMQPIEWVDAGIIEETEESDGLL